MPTLEIWFSKSSRIGGFCFLRVKPSVCDFPKLFFAKYAFLVVCGPRGFCLIISVVKQWPRTISLNVYLQQGKKEALSLNFQIDDTRISHLYWGPKLMQVSVPVPRASPDQLKCTKPTLLRTRSPLPTLAPVPIVKVVPKKQGVVVGSCMPLTKVQKPLHEALLWLL